MIHVPGAGSAIHRGVESEDSIAVAGLDDQLDRELRRLRRSDRVLEYIDLVGGAVDRQDDAVFRDLRLEGSAVIAPRERCRPCRRVRLRWRTASSRACSDRHAPSDIRSSVRIDELVTAAPQSIEGRRLADRIEPRAQKCRPVVGFHGVQCLTTSSKVYVTVVKLAVADAEEGPREVVQRSLFPASARGSRCRRRARSTGPPSSSPRSAANCARTWGGAD